MLINAVHNYLKGEFPMNRHIVLAFLVLLLGILACGGSEDTNQSSPKPAEQKRGWLCDYDTSGNIRLWTAASMDATVKDDVGTCVGCCVDVTLTDETLANSILFYHISVGGQSGWVDVDYFYWRKPSWATN